MTEALQKVLTTYTKNNKDSFAKYKDLPLAKLDGFKLNVGKHKTVSFSEVIDLDPRYCSWVLNNVTEKSPLYLFKHYIHRKLSEHIDNVKDLKEPL